MMCLEYIYQYHLIYHRRDFPLDFHYSMYIRQIYKPHVTTVCGTCNKMEHVVKWNIKGNKINHRVGVQSIIMCSSHDGIPYKTTDAEYAAKLNLIEMGGGRSQSSW